ncbi:hypothetical protein [Bradyrhizobium liaoningense]|uniref:hypothetical protein n=1 Tax=Bradyrhizobium liaoningense TaxID=43992 RepID=UPI001BAB8D1D|nr:hypothetical protein [Bradyrhizobium liaoningense]MBR1170421.1 hypothetical protein [Bradyrhizobium liaoningense]
MSDILQQLLQTRVEPGPKPEWPRWIADALAYKPESAAVVDASPTKPVSPEAEDQRNIRVLTRVSNS